MNLSFAGCGFLGIYHLGVASCFRAYAPHVLLNRASGTSAGSVVAASLLLEAPLSEMASDVLRGVVEAKKGILGPFSPSFDPNMIMGQCLERLLPEDAHLRVNGRLHVSVTNVYDGKNVLVSQFSSKEELINVVLASCFIPVFSGIVPPRYRGSRVIDGGYSNNLPILDSQTITVSPFCGAADICPQDHGLEDTFKVNVSNTSLEMSKENFMRMYHVLLPPDSEVLANYCKQGFDDALRFLQQRYLISCTRCMDVTSTYEIDEEEVYDPSPLVKYNSGCDECLTEKNETRGIEILTGVLEVLKETKSKINKSCEKVISNGLLRILFSPAILYFSVLMWLLDHLVAFLPCSWAWNFVGNLLDQACALAVGPAYLPGQSFLAKYTCVFNITQYGEDSMTDLAKYGEDERRESVKDILNIGLVAHLEAEDSQKMPSTHEAARQFNKENLSAAVVSRVSSCVGSLAPSRRGSVISRAVSRMGSRINSSDSLCDLGQELPGTIDQMKQLTENQEALMSFYYNDSKSQVKMMEIFDVTETDPSLLILDQIKDSEPLDHLKLRSSLESKRARHASAPPTISSHSGRQVSFGPNIGYNGQNNSVGSSLESSQFSDPESEENRNSSYRNSSYTWK